MMTTRREMGARANELILNLNEIRRFEHHFETLDKKNVN